MGLGVKVKVKRVRSNIEVGQRWRLSVRVKVKKVEGRS